MKSWIPVTFVCAVLVALVPLSPARGAQRAKNAAPLPPASVASAVPEKLTRELAAAGRTVVANAAKHVTPGINAKKVVPARNGGYVACYTAVDVSDIRTEVIPTADPDKFLGSIRYTEYEYECPGRSQAEALQAQCRVARARQVDELVRYAEGKWHH